jgi:hypothetical protein
LFPEEDAEIEQSGSEPGRAALAGFVEGAGSMSKKRLANVWDAIEDTPAQAENMKLRSALMMALKDRIARKAKPIGGRQAAWRDPAAHL